MTVTESLQKLLVNQQEQIDILKNSIQELESEGLAKKNDILKGKLESLTDKYESIKAEHTILEDRFKEMQLKERSGLISKAKNDTIQYFKFNERNENNYIDFINLKYKEKLDTLNKASKSELEIIDNILSDKIKRLEDEVNFEISNLRQKNKISKDVLQEKTLEQFDSLEDLPLPIFQEIQKRFSGFTFELKFGTKIINILGVLLILLGVIVGLQYEDLAPELRGAMSYGAGVLFLMWGEFLQARYKKQNSGQRNSTFALGVTAGGVAILFATTAVSYFQLEILNMFMALAFCVAISLVTFFLAVRYNSSTIAIFALLGGYMPIISLIDNIGIAPYMMIYFIMLNILALIISIHKKWVIMNSIAFALSCFAAIAFLAVDISILPSILYLIANFLTFLGVVLIYPIHKKVSKLTLTDIILIAANTIFSSTIIYAVLNRNQEFDYNGLLAIGFLIAYFVGAKTLEKFMPSDRRISNIFYLTSLIFGVLTVPMQFGMQWLLIGWILQGVSVLVYGIVIKGKWTERIGWAIIALAIYSFFTELWFKSRAQLILDYSFLTFSLIGVVFAYYFFSKNNPLFFYTLKGKWILALKNTMLLQNAIYIISLVSFFIWEFGNFRSSRMSGMAEGLINMSLLLGYSIGIKYIPMIKGRSTKIVSLIISISVICFNLVINLFRLTGEDRDLLWAYILVDVLSIIIIYDLIKTFQTFFAKRRILDAAGFISSAYTLMLILMFLVVQFDHSINSILVSSIMLFAAFLWIIFGFIRGNYAMRLFGLIFSLFSLAKLFFIDLYFLEQGLRIISYFIFGVIFLAISFVYQYFNKKFSEKMGDS